MATEYKADLMGAMVHGSQKMFYIPAMCNREYKKAPSYIHIYEAQTKRFHDQYGFVLCAPSPSPLSSSLPHKVRHRLCVSHTYSTKLMI